MKNKISGLFGSGTTRKKVDELLSKKSEVERELAKIRKECTHSSKSVKQINCNGMHSFQIRWVCNDCLAPVGWPTETEKQKYLKN